MGGEQSAAKVVSIGRGGLKERVDALEARMTAVETGMIQVAGHASQAAADAARAVANTDQLLAIANGTRTVIGFVRKHGPKAISFGAGVMTILGIGNPELWKYVSHFFGG